jgi:hypothetical protein
MSLYAQIILEKKLVGDVSLWGPANRRNVGAHHDVPLHFVFAPVVWTHTPSWVAPK